MNSSESAPGSYPDSVFERLEAEEEATNRDILAFIKYFETNSALIEGLNNDNEDEKIFKLRMVGDYGICLAQSGRLEKAVEVLGAFIPRFEKESGLSESELAATPYLEHLLWWLGSSLYYTDKFDDAIKIFERLLIIQPGNQKYRNWLKASFTNTTSKIRNILQYAFLTWVFVYFALRLTTMETGGELLLVGMVILAPLLFLEVDLFIKKRRIR